MKKQLLIEHLNHNVANLISETTTDGKTAWLSGVFMQGEVKNRNGRIYPMNELSKAVTEATERIKLANGIFGELDHPENLNINLERVSHAITHLQLQGDNAIGKAKIINTPRGQIVRGLIESGVLLGVSSRGAGNVDDNGYVNSFNFITIDIVAQPSAPNATPSTIYESLNYSNGSKVLTLAESLCNDKSAQKYFTKEIHKFIENLVNNGVLTVKKK